MDEVINCPKRDSDALCTDLQIKKKAEALLHQQLSQAFNSLKVVLNQNSVLRTMTISYEFIYSSIIVSTLEKMHYSLRLTPLCWEMMKGKTYHYMTHTYLWDCIHLQDACTLCWKEIPRAIRKNLISASFQTPFQSYSLILFSSGNWTFEVVFNINSPANATMS